MHPAKYDLNIQQPLPEPKKAIDMEAKRSKGMEVVYVKPDFMDNIDQEFVDLQKSINRELTFPIKKRVKFSGARNKFRVRRVLYRRNI